jgi:hypothetical protein
MNTMSGAGIAIASVLAVTTAAAGEWKALFNGKDLDGWTNRDGKTPGAGWIVAGGTMAIEKPKTGGDIWTRDRFGDFVLELEFKTAGNSGVFIRTADPKSNVQTGIEIQVNVPGGPDRHSVGSIYDLVAPSKNAGKDGWNKAVITAKGPSLAVELNGEKVAAMDLDRWTEVGRNPDGSKNKFKTALKDFKREGHIGFQDHGAAVAYRNVRIKPLD